MARSESELNYELLEANLELKRHHADFGRIRKFLDEWEDGTLSATECLALIRSVVG